MLLAAQIPSEPFVAALVAAILFALGRLVIRRVAYAEGNPWLIRILTLSLVLHLLAAPAGSADSFQASSGPLATPCRSRMERRSTA